MDKEKAKEIREKLERGVQYLKKFDLRDIKAFPMYQPVVYDKDDLIFIEEQLKSQMDKLNRDALKPEQINTLAWKSRELAEYYISLVEEQS